MPTLAVPGLAPPSRSLRLIVGPAEQRAEGEVEEGVEGVGAAVDAGTDEGAFPGAEEEPGGLARVEVGLYRPGVARLRERCRDGLRPLLEAVPYAAADRVAVVGDLGSEVAEQASPREPVPFDLVPEELEVRPEPGQRRHRRVG